MKVVTFGEALMRLASPAYERLNQAKQFDIFIGGAELNVAVSLANFGIESVFVTKLPAHHIGQNIIQFLRGFNVETTFIVRGGERVGLWFYEHGVSQRPPDVIYDRKNSSITELQKGDINWSAVFQDARWFHFTGISAALNDSVRENLRDACKTAKTLGLTVSCDLNYRAKLWSPDEAQREMIPLMTFVDVCMTNDSDAEKMLGVKTPNGDNAYFKLAETLKKTFNLKAVSITLRDRLSDSFNKRSAVFIDDGDCKTPYLSRSYDMTITEHIGGGDAFDAGLIYGLLMKPNSKEALEFAVAASVLKQSITGDVNRVTAEEVERLVQQGSKGRVER
ncbi:MAG: 2-dehydro-3-deoxygluconokinase [[Candidatus Thermochlorobacteriaceae] bacterium GBChlB]|nr:MAG: 2-dehydro-3-deoxygluconokinase [[Candidatus Thermochlorobacteriaceae] bacterium GBChlB]